MISSSDLSTALERILVDLSVNAALLFFTSSSVINVLASLNSFSNRSSLVDLVPSGMPSKRRHLLALIPNVTALIGIALHLKYDRVHEREQLHVLESHSDAASSTAGTI